MEMVSTSYYDHRKQAVEAGQIDAKLIDDAVRNILRVKFRLGLFDKGDPNPRELPAQPDETHSPWRGNWPARAW